MKLPRFRTRTVIALWALFLTGSMVVRHAVAVREAGSGFDLGGSVMILGHAEALRGRVDPSITPEAAGRALDQLTELPAALPDSVAEEGASSRLERAARGALSTAEVEQLRPLEHSPALQAFRQVALAQEVAVAETRWKMEDRSPYEELLLPMGSGLRSAADAQLALAALHLQSGDTREAERAIRGTISAGLSIAVDAPTALDLVIATHVAHRGLEALRTLYTLTGRQADAERVRAVLDAEPQDVQRDGETLLSYLGRADVPKALRFEELVREYRKDTCSPLLYPLTRDKYEQIRGRYAIDAESRFLIHAATARPTSPLDCGQR